MDDLADLVEKEVVLDPRQRTLIFQKNRGWVKTKRCNFCNDMCHIDQQGVWAFGKTYNSLHNWYCSVQCANGLSYPHLKKLLKPQQQGPART